MAASRYNRPVRGTTELAPGVWGLGSELVNWYLVEDAGRLTAVDAGLPGFRDSLEADLRRIGRSPGDVEAVVLTHSDADHTGLTPAFREAGARVLIHHADEATLRKPVVKQGERTPARLLAQLRHRNVRKILAHNMRNGAMKPARVDGAETFSGGDVLDVPGRPRVIHTPGHTPGHCALLFEGIGVLFVSDALCNHELMTGGGGPVTMPSYNNVDHRAAVESLDAIEDVEAGRLLFGHGGPWRAGAAAAVASARARAAA
jgi:glyoxylase-like metal-dependent hydrolase (beta-lactamase superfamily II)